MHGMSELFSNQTTFKKGSDGAKLSQTTELQTTTTRGAI